MRLGRREVLVLISIALVSSIVFTMIYTGFIRLNMLHQERTLTNTSPNTPASTTTLPSSYRDILELIDPYKEYYEKFLNLTLSMPRLNREEILEILDKFLRNELGIQEYNISYIYYWGPYNSSVLGLSSYTIRVYGVKDGKILDIAVGISDIDGRISGYRYDVDNSTCSIKPVVNRTWIINRIVEEWRKLGFYHANVRPVISKIKFEDFAKRIKIASIEYLVVVNDTLVYQFEGHFGYDACGNFLFVDIPYRVFFALEHGFFIKRVVRLDVDTVVEDYIIRILRKEQIIYRYKLINYSFVWAPYWYRTEVLGAIYIYAYRIYLEIVEDYDGTPVRNIYEFLIDPELGNIIYYRIAKSWYR